MANDNHVNILFPVGRLIQGSLYSPNTKGMNGEPLTVKNKKSPNFGQPRVDYYIGVAIPKTPGVTHWSQEVSQNPRIGAWGKKIWDAGVKFWGDLINQKKTFSWKVIDGDSTEFDGSNPPKRICDKPHHKGHWIVHMGRGMAPKIVNNDGSAYLLDRDVVKLGYYIQVAATLSSNFSDMNQGIYINHDIVSFQYVGEEIKMGIDPSKIGFGGEPIPAAAIRPSMPTPPVTVAPPSPPAPPNYTFVDQAGIKLLKNGATYDSYVGAGWTDEQLKTAGLL